MDEPVLQAVRFIPQGTEQHESARWPGGEGCRVESHEEADHGRAFCQLQESLVEVNRARPQ